MKTLILVVLMSVSAMGIAQPKEHELTRLEDFDVWVHQAFHRGALDTVEGIRALGRLVSEKRHPHEVAHASSDLELAQFVFDGLAIHAVVEKSAPHRVWVTTIEITSPAWPLENGLTVGQHVGELNRLPVLPDVDALRFCGVNNCLVADHRGGIIRSLRLEIYVD